MKICLKLGFSYYWFYVKEDYYYISVSSKEPTDFSTTVKGYGIIKLLNRLSLTDDEVGLVIEAFKITNNYDIVKLKFGRKYIHPKDEIKKKHTCRSITKKGRPCKNIVKSSGLKCHLHKTLNQNEMNIPAKKAHEAGAINPLAAWLPYDTLAPKALSKKEKSLVDFRAELYNSRKYTYEYPKKKKGRSPLTGRVIELHGITLDYKKCKELNFKKEGRSNINTAMIMPLVPKYVLDDLRNKLDDIEWRKLVYLAMAVSYYTDPDIYQTPVTQRKVKADSVKRKLNHLWNQKAKVVVEKTAFKTPYKPLDQIKEEEAKEVEAKLARPYDVNYKSPGIVKFINESAGLEESDFKPISPTPNKGRCKNALDTFKALKPSKKAIHGASKKKDRRKAKKAANKLKQELEYEERRRLSIIAQIEALDNKPKKEVVMLPPRERVDTYKYLKGGKDKPTHTMSKYKEHKTMVVKQQHHRIMRLKRLINHFTKTNTVAQHEEDLNRAYMDRAAARLANPGEGRDSVLNELKIKIREYLANYFKLIHVRLLTGLRTELKRLVDEKVTVVVTYDNTLNGINRKHLHSPLFYNQNIKSNDGYIQKFFKTQEDADRFYWDECMEKTSSAYLKIPSTSGVNKLDEKLFMVEFKMKRNRKYNSLIKRKRKSMNYVGVVKAKASNPKVKGSVRLTENRALVCILDKDSSIAYRIPKLQAKELVRDNKNIVFITKAKFKGARLTGKVLYEFPTPTDRVEKLKEAIEKSKSKPKIEYKPSNWLIKRRQIQRLRFHFRPDPEGYHTKLIASLDELIYGKYSYDSQPSDVIEMNQKSHMAA